jgi:carbamoyl-phosphate synthase large subunit
MRSKVNLAKLGERIGVSVPQTVILGGLDDLYGLHHRLAYPVVIKGVFYGASICRTIDEASKAYHCTVAQWGLPVIAQGYVEGEELNVVAVGDGEGGLVGAVAMKKVFVTDKGKGWAGITIRNPELLELTRTFVDKTGWRGPCELEVMRDAAGALHLLEVNPRFPAWVYLSQGAGCNLPAALLRLARGEAVEPMTDYQVGKMFVRISIDQIADLGDLESITATGELLAGPGLRQEFQHET